YGLRERVVGSDIITSLNRVTGLKLQTNQPDVWAELRALRDMMVKQRMKLMYMEARMTASESQVGELKMRERREELSITNTELQSHKNTIDGLKKENKALMAAVEKQNKAKQRSRGRVVCHGGQTECQ
ncbi:unnamed protein product, partial [Coregonus sp. 'balchen']